MINKNFVKLDLSAHTGRIFVVGDIHGAFTKLEKALADVNFNWDTDVLLSVGDLVDRGPESHLAVDYLEKPNFHAVKGNHEQMCLEAGGTSWHEGNGGRWWKKLRYSHSKRPQADFIRAFRAMPIIIEVKLPSGRRIGLVHAAFGSNDWNDAEDVARNSSENCMWDREPIRAAQWSVQYDKKPTNIENIDHIYYGHTPIDAPLHYGNQSWIDTGAVWDDGYFTLIEVF